MSNPTRCAACRYLRRRCCEDCALAPYFPSANPQRFACVHRIFGASNVARMLQIPETFPDCSCLTVLFYSRTCNQLTNTDIRMCISQQIPVEHRRQAADAIAMEAYWRVQDPVYGSVGFISMLQREISVVQRELAETQAQITMYASQAQSQPNQIAAAQCLVEDGHLVPSQPLFPGLYQRDDISQETLRRHF
ncbi:hypothetical protein C4D60_Mb11t04640 [Musa balbisiana]|uniref:LOB domain-containing protein n=1 Tax=Musa balbisiana TaxID=52838 RepID=A0A4S8J1V1_MUSBA|nr:hypothetical protein C4D60_Mb11t04640 [Musa balbisiana]